MPGGSIQLGPKRSASGLKPDVAPVLPFGRNRGRVERLDEGEGFEWIREALARTQEALETLWEAEELHRLLFVKVPQPRFVCDSKTLNILAVNEAAIRQYKYSRQEFHRMRVTDLSAPESHVDFKKYCERLSSVRNVATNRGDHVFRHRRKDGRFINVNEEYIRVTGYSREELVGATSMALGITYSEIYERVRQTINEQGFVRNLEAKLKTKTGDI